jgi:hypothetical protein
MRNFVDYSGRRFGAWFIIRPLCAPATDSGGEPGLGGAPAGYLGKWLVRCDCNRKFKRNISAIVNGKSQCCGECSRQNQKRENHRNFLVARAR